MAGVNYSYNRRMPTFMIVQIAVNLSLFFGVWLVKGDTEIGNFVFGDSLVDVGNNNYIVSLAKADFPPHGIDFGGHTGRFTNGKTILDIIGQELGFENYPPPYMAPTTRGPVVYKGVNYASGGGGILKETGAPIIGRFSMDAQLENFAKTSNYILTSLGEESGLQLLKKSLFTVTIGGNDFILNRFIPVVSIATQILETPEEFVDSLITNFRRQLTWLYEMGARKIVVSNVPPVGCIPFERDINIVTDEGNCVEEQNKLVEYYNDQLKTLIFELSHLDDSIFVYADFYNVFLHIFNNPSSYGIENPDSACCHTAGKFGGLLPCTPVSDVCPDRSKYIFWDQFHPSEVTNAAIAKQFLYGDSSVISPINIHQLFYKF